MNLFNLNDQFNKFMNKTGNTISNSTAGAGSGIKNVFNIVTQPIVSAARQAVNSPPLQRPLSNALSAVNQQVNKMRLPFLVAGYNGVQPWQITPKMRLNTAMQFSRQPTLPSEGNTYVAPNRGIEAWMQNMNNRKGPLKTVTPSNIGGYQAPRSAPLDILPNDLLEMKRRAAQFPPVPMRLQQPKSWDMEFKNFIKVKGKKA